MAKQSRAAKIAAPKRNRAAAHRSVNSLADYVTTTLKIKDQWWREDEDERRKARESGEEDGESPPPSEFWFRGHAEARWALKPRLYRPENRFKLEDEDEIRTDFKRRGRQLITESSLPANDKEWYFLMQHYGAPTRLLDWTDGSLLGLYFALRDEQHADRPRDAAVWMLDPNWLNEITLKAIYGEHNYMEGVLLPEWKETDVWFPVPFEQSTLVNEPVAIDPPHVARRVAVQHSHFTIHGRSQSGLEGYAREGNSRLVKIIIPAGATQTILGDLAACGITETTVYPDLEALSREVSVKWRRRLR